MRICVIPALFARYWKTSTEHFDAYLRHSGPVCSIWEDLLDLGAPRCWGGCKIAAKVPRDTPRDKTPQIGLKMKGFAMAFDSPYKSHFWGSPGGLPGASWVASLMRGVGKGARAILMHICAIPARWRIKLLDLGSTSGEAF